MPHPKGKSVQIRKIPLLMKNPLFSFFSSIKVSLASKTFFILRIALNNVWCGNDNICCISSKSSYKIKMCVFVVKMGEEVYFTP